MLHGSDCVGALIGRGINGTFTLTNCYNEGIISGANGTLTGGMAGMFDNVVMTNCYSKGNT